MAEQGRRYVALDFGAESGRTIVGTIADDKLTDVLIGYLDPTDDVPPAIQERAYTSPIWYTPKS